MIGVYSLEIARLYQYILQKETGNFMLVHGLDGYDEISLTADTKIFTNNGEQILSAEELGFKNIAPESIFGGKTKEEAAKTFLKILTGEGTPEQNSVVLANAAKALENSGKYTSYEDALAAASESLVSKKAFESFKKLVK